MKKRMISLIFCLVLCLSLMPMTVFAETEINEIVITDADITPVAGEKAGEHLAFNLPEESHIIAVMNGWWDIFNSRILADDDLFEAGCLYCASWNFIADEGYAFGENITVTINGSADLVDTEHSYLDTSGDEPLYILSAYGVFAEEPVGPVTPVYTLTTSVEGGHGTVSESKSDIEENTVETVIFTPDEGYETGTVKVNGEEIAVFADELNVTMDEDKDVVVSFKEKSPEPPILIHVRVEFNMGGHGTQIETQTIEDGGNAERPEDPSEEGYIFEDWYADAEFTAKFDFSAPVTENTTIYAKWTEKIAAAPADAGRTSPKTGDNSRVILWSTLLAVGCGTLAGILGFDKKRRNSN